jgi:carbonic anhydrase
MVDAIIPAAEAVKGKPGDFVDNAVRENAKRTAGLILKNSKIIEEAVHAGKVKIVAGYYDLDTGMVEFFA